MMTCIKVLPLLLLLFGSSAHAAPLYKWKDASGTVHYSTKKQEGAKKATLPPISRGEVKLTTKKFLSCKDHGGIDCQAGADVDGSVICYDGFPDASARYRFSCTSPKLEITEISDLAENRSFTVFVRNSKSVAASKPAVFYTGVNGQKFELEGPTEIEAFGLAEFTYTPDPIDGEPLKKVTIAQLNITCANCS